MFVFSKDSCESLGRQDRHRAGFLGRLPCTLRILVSALALLFPRFSAPIPRALQATLPATWTVPAIARPFSTRLREALVFSKDSCESLGRQGPPLSSLLGSFSSLVSRTAFQVARLRRWYSAATLASRWVGNGPPLNLLPGPLLNRHSYREPLKRDSPTTDLPYPRLFSNPRHLCASLIISAIALRSASRFCASAPAIALPR